MAGQNNCNPLQGKERINSRSSSIPKGSRPLVGSSRIKSWGLFSNAIAIPSRCFIPRENCPARFLPVFVSWTICNTSLIRASSRPSNVVLTLRFSYAVDFRKAGASQSKHRYAPDHSASTGGRQTRCFPMWGAKCRLSILRSWICQPHSAPADHKPSCAGCSVTHCLPPFAP